MKPTMRTILALLLLLTLPLHSWAMEHYSNVVQNVHGEALRNVTVSVYEAGTSTLATIYSDNGVTTKANPMTTGTDGVYHFYAANGRYDITYAKSGYTFTDSITAGITIFDPTATGAPTDATYLTQTANASLTGEQALGSLSTGCMASTTTTGVVATRTLTGTANEVTVTNGDCSAAPIFSLPLVIDLGGKTSLEIPNGAAPTTSVFGQIAGDNNAWASGRGAIQFYDGTANTYVLAALASDTPANGECAKWNTGGTITWESCASGASGTIGGTVGSTADAIPRADSTGGSTLKAGLCTQSDAGGIVCPDGFESTAATVGTIEMLEGTAPGAGSDTGLHNLYFDTDSKLKSHENGGSAKTYLTNVVKRKFWLPVAGTNDAIGGAVWDMPAANAPAASSITGTNIIKGVLDFDDTTDESVQLSYMLPANWTGDIDVKFVWLASATTGAVGWCLQLVSTADAEADDPAFPAQGAGNCVSDTTKGTANQLNTATISAVTATGVAAGELLHMRLSRDADGGAVTDSMSGDARLLGIELTIQEELQTP